MKPSSVTYVGAYQMTYVVPSPKSTYTRYNPYIDHHFASNGEIPLYIINISEKEMAAVSIKAPGASGSLYNKSSGRMRLCISAETPDFDTEILRNWRDEEFEVVYLPFNEGGKDYQTRLHSVKDGLGVGESYAIIGKLTTYV